VVRFSERIRGVFCGETPSGRRISRRRVAAVFLPTDVERVIGPSRVVCRPFPLRESDDQSLWMHLDARNVSFDQAAVIHCRRRFEVLTDRSDDDRPQAQRPARD
jgi:hypothetical protein